MSELDDLRERYKDDPVVLRAIEREVALGATDTQPRPRRRSIPRRPNTHYMLGRTGSGTPAVKQRDRHRGRRGKGMTS